MALKVVCVHQGYELYGSDRVFVEAVRMFRQALPNAQITVLLPQPGPIVELIAESRCSILFGELFVLRRRRLIALVFGAPFTLTSKIVAAMRVVRAADILYVSTVVVLNFMIAARCHPNAIVHVHEIPSPARLRFFKALVRFSGARTIFNSKATLAAYKPGTDDSACVYNGYLPSREPSFTDYDGTRPLKLLMIGRISKAKGQDLIIRAIASLPTETRKRLQLRIVGDSFERDPFEGTVRELVAELGLQGSVTCEPFNPDPVDVYTWSDVLVAPSRVVESFGLVAVEAMAYGKSVIASAQGGMREIVVDGSTGWLFRAGDVDQLAACVAEAIEAPDLVVERGREGYRRFIDNFHMNRMSQSLRTIFASAAQSAGAGDVR